MSAFLSPLILQDDNGFPMTLVVALVYDSDILKHKVTVPAGFKTDLASIPRGLWNILPREGRYDKAAVIHDYIYAVNGCTRGQADGVLKEAMDVLGVQGFQKWAIYLGVRAGGWKVWNRYRSTKAWTSTTT